MRFRDRLRRLERDTGMQTVELRCPKCGDEFVAKGGDPVLDYLAWEWAEGYPGETYRETPADVLTIANHEHDAAAFINKATGQPWLGEVLGSILNVHRHRDEIPDLSEP